MKKKLFAVTAILLALVLTIPTIVDAGEFFILKIPDSHDMLLLSQEAPLAKRLIYPALASNDCSVPASIRLYLQASAYADNCLKTQNAAPRGGTLQDA